MRIVRRVLGVVVVLVLVAVGLQVVASETGEVVTVHVVDAEGAEHTTRIWVADDLGHVWIRGVGQEGSWAARAAANPELRLERGGDMQAYLAVAQKEPAVRQRINDRFNEKYGWRDTLISWMIGDPGREGALVLKLQPRKE